jgi:hypothetical protein
LSKLDFLEDEEDPKPREKPQVPPLRYASVGMTILLRDQLLFRSILSGLYRIVIPTGAKRSGATVWFVKISGMDWLWKRRGRVRLENAKRFPLFPNAAAAGILS